MLCTTFSRSENSVVLIVLSSPQSRNIDNEFDYQQLAYFKTRIGVSNSFQVRKKVYSGDKGTRCFATPTETAGFRKSAGRLSSLKGKWISLWGSNSSLSRVPGARAYGKLFAS